MDLQPHSPFGAGGSPKSNNKSPRQVHRSLEIKSQKSSSPMLKTNQPSPTFGKDKFQSGEDKPIKLIDDQLDAGKLKTIQEQFRGSQ